MQQSDLLKKSRVMQCMYEKAEDEGEHPSYVSDRGVISITDLTPAMIDNYNLLVPIQYFAFEKIASHIFFYGIL